MVPFKDTKSHVLTRKKFLDAVDQNNICHHFKFFSSNHCGVVCLYYVSQY